MAFEFQIRLAYSPLAVALLPVRSPFVFLQIPTPQAPFVFDTSALQIILGGEMVASGAVMTEGSCCGWPVAGGDVRLVGGQDSGRSPSHRAGAYSGYVTGAAGALLLSSTGAFRRGPSRIQVAICSTLA